jgi:hypothetical protein
LGEDEDCALRTVGSGTAICGTASTSAIGGSGWAIASATTCPAISAGAEEAGRTATARTVGTTCPRAAQPTQKRASGRTNATGSIGNVAIAATAAATALGLLTSLIGGSGHASTAGVAACAPRPCGPAAPRTTGCVLGTIGSRSRGIRYPGYRNCRSRGMGADDEVIGRAWGYGDENFLQFTRASAGNRCCGASYAIAPTALQQYLDE